MKTIGGLKIVRLAPILAVAAMLAFALPAVRGEAPRDVQVAGLTSGFYDNKIVEYQATPEVTSSPQAAQQISHGNIVFHIVGADGATPPAVQCARLLAALPNVQTSCNTLNFIPTDIGYTGGAWNLQIFHWKAGVNPTELSSDTDIAAAVAAGKGLLEVTPILVRCPVVNFFNLR
jgi:hypothetical protein